MKENKIVQVVAIASWCCDFEKNTIMKRTENRVTKDYILNLRRVYSIVSLFGIAAVLFLLIEVAIYFVKIRAFLIPKELIIPIILCISTVLIAIIVRSGIIYCVKMKNVNIIDAGLIVAFFSALLLLLVCVINNNDKCLFYCALTIAIVSAFMIARAYHCREADKRDEGTRLIDLRDLYEGSCDVGFPFLISERDVDYDLLDRTAVIKQLETSLKSVNADHSIVIGLEGEWGQGKTTILNIVKRRIKEKEDIIIIDDFDPWMFGTQEAMLSAMYDTILFNTGMRYGYLRNKKAIKNLSKVIANIPSIGGVASSLVFSEGGSVEQTKKLKRDIKEYLEKNNKQCLFIIDNIERAESDKVIFLFKVIGTIFDLPNIVYILSYSKKRMTDIFEKTLKIDSNYIEKIIQQELAVPRFSEERMRDVIERCVYNYISLAAKRQVQNGYDDLTNMLVDQVKDLRQLKRLLNSAFFTALNSNNNLNKKTLLIIETIRFMAPEIYYSIWKNREYFISYHQQYDASALKLTLDKRSSDEKRKKFFDNLFENNGVYKDVLASIFPSVEMYDRGYNTSSMYDKSEDVDIEKSIASTKYFSLYFSYSSNEFSRIEEDVESFVELINSGGHAIEDIWVRKISAINPYEHKVWLEHFYNHLNNISNEIYLDLAKVIFVNNAIVDNTPYFLEINGRLRAIYIVSELLSNLSEEELKLFVDIVKDKYNLLSEISTIASLVQKRNGKSDILKQTFEKMCKDVISLGINLFDDDNYIQYNIWGLNNSSEKDNLKAYIKTVFCDDNVYKIVADSIQSSIGQTFIYVISKEEYELLGLNELNVENAIKNNPPTNAGEQFVYEALKKYVENGMSDSDKARIESNVPIKLKL